MGVCMRGFLMFDCVYVWVLFCNVLFYVCVDFIMYSCVYVSVL